MPEQRLLVRVRIDGIDRTFAYEAPSGTRIGDKVTVPPFYYEPQDGPPHHGTVTAYGASYEGPARQVVSVSPAAAHPAKD